MYEPLNRQQPLPDHIVTEIDRLQTYGLPESFIEASERAAHYIMALDHNAASAIQKQDIQQFVRSLAGSSFILRHKYESPEALPAWLQDDFLKNYMPKDAPLPDNGAERISSGYRTIMQRLPFYTEDYIYENNDPALLCPPPRAFKYYVGYTDALAAIDEGRLEKCLLQMHGTPEEPHATKGNGEELVFYSRGDIDSAPNVFRILHANGIHPRGPAQDVYRVRYDSVKNVFSLPSIESNDQALVHRVELPDNYDAAGFLHGLIELCEETGKAPDNVYLTNFIYMMPDVDIDSPNERARLLKEAADIAGYPTVYMPAPRPYTPRLILPL